MNTTKISEWQNIKIEIKKDLEFVESKWLEAINNGCSRDEHNHYKELYDRVLDRYKKHFDLLDKLK